MKQTSVEFAPSLAIAPSQRVLTRRIEQSEGLARPAFAIAVAAVPLLAAVPLGSHRAIYWMIWTMIIATMILTVLIATPPKERFSMPGLVGLATAFLVFIVAQILPVGFLLGLERARISVDTGATVLGGLRWASYAGFFWLMCQVSQNRRHARLMAWVLFGGIVVHAIWALVAFRFLGDAALWGQKLHYHGAVTGTFVNRNAYAVFLGFGMILGLGLLAHDALRADRDRRRMAVLLSPMGLWTATLWLCLGLLGMAMFGTASRFGIFASLLAALFLVGALAAKHSGSGRFTAKVVVWWSALVIGVFAVVGRPALERAIFTQIDSQDRISLYIQTLELIRKNPIFGVGFDGFETAFQSVHRTPLSPDLFWDRAHSTYLSLWAEMGLIAGSIPPMICALIAATLLMRLFRAKRDFAFVIIALSAIALGGVHSLIDFSLEISANVYVFLALVALGVTSGAGMTTGGRS
ncbi:MAG: O-antigen ligase family protein [Pseudomonadota bacterium]